MCHSLPTHKEKPTAAKAAETICKTLSSLMSFNVFLKGVLLVRGAQVCQQDRKDNIIRSHGHSSQVHLSALSTSSKTSKLLTACQDTKRKSDHKMPLHCINASLGCIIKGGKTKAEHWKSIPAPPVFPLSLSACYRQDQPMSTLRLLDGTFGILLILWFQTFLWAVYARSYHKINHEKPLRPKNM